MSDTEKTNFEINQEELHKLFKPQNDSPEYRELRADFDRNLKSMPGEFGGPCIYFHYKAIEKAEKEFLKDGHLEMVYAVLTGWGMHSTRPNPKLREFGEFKEEIRERINEIDAEVIEKFRSRSPLKNINDEDIDIIVTLISSLQVNKSENTRIVSASKTLHHIFPNLIPPIDWKYSIKFMMKRPPFDNNSQQYKNDAELAKQFFKGMCNFISTNEPSMSKLVEEAVKYNATEKACEKGMYDFNTSLPKVFDNLIIAFVKMHKEKTTESKL